MSRLSAELYHHGILGQKWGIRRYQNRDGSLTPAGRERYRKNAEKLYNSVISTYKINDIVRKSTSAYNDAYTQCKKEYENFENFATSSEYNKYIKEAIKYWEDVNKSVYKDPEDANWITELTSFMTEEAYSDNPKIRIRSQPYERAYSEYAANHPEILEQESKKDKAIERYTDRVKDLVNDSISQNGIHVFRRWAKYTGAYEEDIPKTKEEVSAQLQFIIGSILDEKNNDYHVPFTDQFYDQFQMMLSKNI